MDYRTKLSEENMQENLSELGLGKDVLRKVFLVDDAETTGYLYRKT